MTAKTMLTMLGIAVVIVVGGSNDTAQAGIDAGGAPATSQGAVTQFSSIYVNGVKFETDTAAFIVDGELGQESDLRVGQIVTVYGWVNEDGETGTANLVTYENALRGPVSAVSAAESRLTVLGHSVIVGADTSYSVGPDVDSIGDLQAGDVVEVSGHFNADGIVVATHISNASSLSDFDVTGVVTDVAADGSYRLNIGDLQVDFGGASFDGFGPGSPLLGARVEISGNQLSPSGELVATWIRSAPHALSGIAGDAAEVEGLITSYASPWSFDVNGVPVSLAWNAQFTGGWLFDLGTDVKVEIEGYFDGAGGVIAESVEFESASSASISGIVQSIDGDTIVIDGAAYQVTMETEFEDDSIEDERRFGVDDLRSGDYVRVNSYGDGTNAIATRLERHDDDDDSDSDD